MRTICAFLLTAFCVADWALAQAGPERSLLREPSISSTQVVFTSRGHVWIAPRSGGSGHAVSEQRYRPRKRQRPCFSSRCIGRGCSLAWSIHHLLHRYCSCFVLHKPIPDCNKNPRNSTKRFALRDQRFACARLAQPCLPESSPDVSATFATIAFDNSSLRWLEINT